MKRGFLKAAFLFRALSLGMVVAVPMGIAPDRASPVVRSPDGLYRGGDRTWMGIVPLFVGAWVGHRLASWLFWSDGRRSIITNRRGRRSG